tara:strand:- start:402 stop:617 length:216 start_codon:yes stop_codon:yes gene_type:complete
MDTIEEVNFCQMVEDAVVGCDSYIEAVIRSCNACNIDVASGARMLSRPIIEKIQKEGEDSNLLPKIAKLPL